MPENSYNFLLTELRTVAKHIKLLAFKRNENKEFSIGPYGLLKATNFIWKAPPKCTDRWQYTASKTARHHQRREKELCEKLWLSTQRELREAVLLASGINEINQQICHMLPADLVSG